MDVCIHHQLADTIAGLEAWYQQVIDKLSNFDPSFAKEWNFSGLIGPLPSTTSSALVSWFQIAILFAKVNLKLKFNSDIHAKTDFFLRGMMRMR